MDINVDLPSEAFKQIKSAVITFSQAYTPITFWAAGKAGLG
jgi:hypothetical protein